MTEVIGAVQQKVHEANEALADLRSARETYSAVPEAKQTTRDYEDYEDAMLAAVEPLESVVDAFLPIVTAAEALAALHPDVWRDTATSFGCTEAEAIAGLLDAAGATGVARMFLEAHAEGDEDGDEHYQGA
ncbi:MAG: hypothetical protein KF727_14370 [Microbacteriaceae bacterium]|nr:hypothetical protein [Microbacteriaceae bacterium]